MDKRIEYYSVILIVNLPNADAITRRLKKLVSMIFKLSNEKGNQKEKLKEEDDNILLGLK